MKRISLCILTLLTSLLSLTATAQQVMTVHQKDGTVKTFPLTEVDQVTFDKATLPKLDNQYAVDSDVKSVGTVFMTKQSYDNEFALYQESGLTEQTPDKAMLVITLPDSLIGQTIDLTKVDYNTVTIAPGADADYYDFAEGTLKVSFDKFGNKVTFALESQTTTGSYVRLAYTGAFVRAYKADNAFIVAPQGQSGFRYNIASVLRVKPATTGAATQLAFGDATATTAEGLKQSHAAVWFTVSAAKLNSSLDLATDKASYTLRYIDYATGTTQENTVASGTLTTAQADGDKVYFSLFATLEDGTFLQARYYGTVTDVDQLDEMVPTPVLPNKVMSYDADGNLQVDQAILSLKYEESKYSGRKFYFATEGGNLKDPMATPVMQFSDALVNAGKIELANLKDGDGFYFQYKGVTLASPEAKYYGYMNNPNNGTLTITLDADGNYDIYLDVTNKYNTPGMNVTNGGDGTRIVLSYKGKAEKL